MAEIERAIIKCHDYSVRQVTEETLVDFVDLDREDFEDWREIYHGYYAWMIVRERGNPATVVSLGRPLTHEETDDLVETLSSEWQGPFELTTGGFPQPAHQFEASCLTVLEAASLLHAEADRTKFVHHVTFRDRIEAIASDGLLPGMGDKDSWDAHHARAWEDVAGRLFHVPTIEDAEVFAEWLARVKGNDLQDAVYLRIDRKDLGAMTTDFAADEYGGTYSLDAVRPEAVEVLVGGAWRSLVDAAPEIASNPVPEAGIR